MVHVAVMEEEITNCCLLDIYYIIRNAPGLSTVIRTKLFVIVLKTKIYHSFKEMHTCMFFQQLQLHGTHVYQIFVLKIHIFVSDINTSLKLWI